MQCRTQPSPPTTSDSGSSALPADLLRRIDDLRRCMVDAEDFGVSFDRFDIHIASCPALFDYSDPKPNPQLTRTIAACVRRIKPDFAIVEHLMFEVATTGLWHGLALGRREQVFFYFFDDIGMGLLGVSDPFDPRGKMHLVRFTKVQAYAPVMPGPAQRAQA